MSVQSRLLSFVAITLIAALPAAAQRRPAASSTTLSASDITLYARMLQLADQREFNDTLLRQGLSSSSGAVRRAASYTLAQLGGMHRAEVLPLLRESATSTDTAVAANAFFGLGLVADTTSADLFVSGVARDGEVGQAAAAALGSIGARGADGVRTMLANRNLSPGVITELLLAAARTRPVDLAAVSPYLTNRNMTVRWAAVYAIARRRNPSGVRALLKVKGDANVRAEIANGMSYQAAGDSLRREALNVLNLLVADDYPQVRINALRALSTFGPNVAPLVQQFALDRDPLVRMTVAQVAGSVFTATSEAWQELWKVDTAVAYRIALMTSSVKAGLQNPLLDKWRTDRDIRYRMGSVSAWTDSPDTVQAKTVGLIAAHDSSGMIRATAYALLGAMDPQGKDSIVQRTLLVAQRDSDLAAREGNPQYVRQPTAIDSSNRHRSIDWYENVVREVVVPTLAKRPRSVTMVTERGTIGWVLLGTDAPLTVYNFIALAKKGFFNGLRFPRVVPNFVVQGGDPRGDTNGGPGYAIRDELNREPFTRGAVGMALGGPDTGGSQYFMMLSYHPHLNGRYPLFGRVVIGLAVMDALVQNDRVLSVTIQ